MYFLRSLFGTSPNYFHPSFCWENSSSDIHPKESLFASINVRYTVLLRNNLSENAFGTRPERVRNAYLNAFLNAFHLRSIRVPFAFQSRSIRVPFAFHSRCNCVPFAFHLRSTVTGTHLRDAFRLHSYRNRTSSEIIESNRYRVVIIIVVIESSR
jgi:hypothetical protein